MRRLQSGLFLHVLRRWSMELVLHHALQRVRRLAADALVDPLHGGDLRALHLNRLLRGRVT